MLSEGQPGRGRGWVAVDKKKGLLVGEGWVESGPVQAEGRPTAPHSICSFVGAYHHAYEYIAYRGFLAIFCSWPDTCVTEETYTSMEFNSKSEKGEKKKHFDGLLSWHTGHSDKSESSMNHPNIKYVRSKGNDMTSLKRTWWSVLFPAAGTGDKPMALIQSGNGERGGEGVNKPLQTVD